MSTLAPRVIALHRPVPTRPVPNQAVPNEALPVHAVAGYPIQHRRAGTVLLRALTAPIRVVLVSTVVVFAVVVGVIQALGFVALAGAMRLNRIGARPSSRR